MTTQRKGRRSPAPGGRRLSVLVWLSEREMEQIAGMATAEGLAMGAWLGEAGVRAATQARDIVAADPVLRLRELMDVHLGLVDLRKHLSKVGVNLNQIARHANSAGVLPDATARVLTLVTWRVRQVDDALRELRRLIALARPQHGVAPDRDGRSRL